MSDDLGLFDAPGRPQFGKLVACCDARTPKVSVPVVVVLSVAFVVLAPVAVIAVLQALRWWEANGLQGQNVQAAGVGVILLSAFFASGLAIYVMRQLARSGYSKTRLTVYENGLHAVCTVNYFVSYGQWAQFCSGVRQVSRSFRFVKQVQVREKKQKGKACVTAEVSFTDGDTVRIRSSDGGETLSAIESIVRAAGEKAVVNLKS